MSDYDVAVDERTTPFTYHLQTGEQPSEGVVQAVANASGRPPVGTGSTDGRDVLPPLFEAVDPDALDTLVAPHADRPHTPQSVVFSYADYRIAIDRTGRIEVAAMPVTEAV